MECSCWRGGVHVTNHRGNRGTKEICDRRRGGRQSDLRAESAWRAIREAYLAGTGGDAGAHDGEAEANATGFSGAREFGTKERLAQTIQVRGRYAWAVVLDDNGGAAGFGGNGD